MSQATGRVTVEVDSVALRSKKGASIYFGGEKRTPDVTDQGLFFYTAENVPAEIEATLVHMSDTDVLALQQSKNVTVHFKTDTGVVFTVANAVCVEPLKLQNGECPVKFAGSAAKQS